MLVLSGFFMDLRQAFIEFIPFVLGRDIYLLSVGDWFVVFKLHQIAGIVDPFSRREIYIIKVHCLQTHNVEIKISVSIPFVCITFEGEIYLPGCAKIELLGSVSQESRGVTLDLLQGRFNYFFPGFPLRFPGFVPWN